MISKHCSGIFKLTLRDSWETGVTWGMFHFLGNSDSVLTCWYSQILSVTENCNGLNLASDWLSVIMWHNTVSSLVICNKTQPSDWLLPDWPQIVNNCTEQVSPQPWADTTHWIMLLTTFEVLLMLTLSRSLIIQSPSRSRSYMGGDSGTSLGLKGQLKRERFSHDSSQSYPKKHDLSFYRQCLS